MKKNEDVYVKKGSYVKRHWKQWWALITFIPFAVALFLSWIYGAAGGYEWISQVKLFFLFLQIGFITVYFLREGIMKAVVNLWATLIFLWILSLIVPYLSTQTNTVLDMSEAAGELSTPLYLFVSCLTVAWLLPGRWRMVARLLCSLLMIFYVLIQFTYIGYYFLTQSLLSVSMMIATAQTNVSEAVEYIEVNLPYSGLVGGVIAIVCLGWWIFKANRFSFAPPMRVSKRVRIFVLILFLFNCGLAALSIGATRIARVSAETYTTLQSFGEYQKILEKRRNMRITDSGLREQLKAVPDGVYILVIGESLTREHMHVYGYDRETTPFQTSAYFDPHYKFFGHVYSCYTQTVQVLTQALTEKNQYNGMVLADAYSLIDMAREAGFHTTWISNQSRFGIWDTPIGAIGSECDDQYWINQYVGTDVVTKDYDTALILGVDILGGFSALVDRGMSHADKVLINSIPEALATTKSVCSSVAIGSTKAGINMDAVRRMGEVIKETAELTKENDAYGCTKLVEFCNAVEDNPFMAGAFHGVTQGDTAIHVGVSGPGVVKRALEDVKGAPLQVVAKTVKNTAFMITRLGQLVAEAAVERLGAPFGIIDLSLAPTAAVGDSVAAVLEEMGLESCGAPGTTAALALLNDAVKKGGLMASSSVGGLSGAFIPVSEDLGMIQAVERGALSLEKLEAMTCVCSVGLDMIAVPGTTSAETLSAILADEAAIGMINNKTTATRLIPALGKKPGDMVNFGGLMGYAPVIDVNPFKADEFIHRGGKIPAPIRSLTN